MIHRLRYVKLAAPKVPLRVYLRASVRVLRCQLPGGRRVYFMRPGDPIPFNVIPVREYQDWRYARG